MNADEARKRGLGAARGIGIGVIGGFLFWLTVAAIVIVLATSCTRTETVRVTGPTQTQTDTGLVSDTGATVSEGVATLYRIGAEDVICPLIDQYGEAAARQAWIEAEPSVGSDAYEAAVFDAWLATGPCTGVYSA